MHAKDEELHVPQINPCLFLISKCPSTYISIKFNLVSILCYSIHKIYIYHILWNQIVCSLSKSISIFTELRLRFLFTIFFLLTWGKNDMLVIKLGEPDNFGTKAGFKGDFGYIFFYLKYIF